MFAAFASQGSFSCFHSTASLLTDLFIYFKIKSYFTLKKRVLKWQLLFFVAGRVTGCEVKWSFNKSNRYKRKHKPTLYTQTQQNDGDNARPGAHVFLYKLYCFWANLYLFKYRCLFFFFFLFFKVPFAYLCASHLWSIPLLNSRGRNELTYTLRNKGTKWYNSFSFFFFFYLQCVSLRYIQ